ALEAYRQVLAGQPGSAPAWNGVGLVLVELKRFPDARNAFVRAVEADPQNAGAHYNLSFTLSNLGDYDGALRATKRALELDPYYVSQKFALAIDLQYETVAIGIVPEISADVTAETLGGEFAFDQRLLDNIFQELEPAATAAQAAPGGLAKKADDPLALARDYVSKGMMDLAVAEAMRAVQRGADRGQAATMIGDIYARRGLHGEALERYREARIARRSIWMRDSCRSGSSSAGYTNRMKNGRTRSARLKPRSRPCQPFTKRAWRWPTCCAAPATPAPRSSGSPTCWSRTSTTWTRCCCWAARCWMTSGRPRRWKHSAARSSSIPGTPARCFISGPRWRGC